MQQNAGVVHAVACHIHNRHIGHIVHEIRFERSYKPYQVKWVLKLTSRLPHSMPRANRVLSSLTKWRATWGGTNCWLTCLYTQNCVVPTQTQHTYALRTCKLMPTDQLCICIAGTHGIRTKYNIPNTSLHLPLPHPTPPHHSPQGIPSAAGRRWWPGPPAWHCAPCAAPRTTGRWPCDGHEHHMALQIQEALTQWSLV